MDTVNLVVPFVTVGEVNAFLEEHQLAIWADKTLRDHLNKLLGGLSPLVMDHRDDEEFMKAPLPESLRESFIVLQKVFAHKAMAKS